MIVRNGYITPRQPSDHNRGFTLLESIAAILILALAVPSTVVMLSDAARSRADAALTTRATWLAHAVMEQIRADVASAATGLGMDGLADEAIYLDTPVTGLRDRLDGVSDLYAQFGLSYDVSIGALIDHSGIVTGDVEDDIYRSISITVSWISTTGDAQSLGIAAIVTDLGGL